MVSERRGLGIAWGFVLAIVVGCGGAPLGGGGTGGAGGITGGTAGSSGTTGRGGSGPYTGGDAGYGCPAWRPPDAPDGGYAPQPPPGGLLTNGKPGCGQLNCGNGTSQSQQVSVDNKALGFSANDLLDQINSPGTALLTWYDGTSTTLSLHALLLEPSVFIDGPHALDAGAAAGDCWEMRIDGVKIALTTDDARLYADTFSGSIIAQSQGGTKQIWVQVNSLAVSALQGVFQVPQAWRTSQTTQTLILALTPPASTCNASCPMSADPSAFAFSNTSFLCGFDGKIIWTGVSETQYPCPQTAVVASWQWNQ